MTVRNDNGFQRRAPRSRAGVGAVAALVVLAAGALFVALFLPSYIAPSGNRGAKDRPLSEAVVETPVVIPAPAPVQATPSTPAPQATPPAPATNANRSEAEKLLAEALRRLAKLEGEGARIWGSVIVDGVSLASAEELLAKANGLYDRQQFSEAAAAFRDAIAALDKLAESKGERFRAAMNSGQQAFAALDAATALPQFEIAAALMPGDAAAARFVERARALPEVLQNMTSGQGAESSGNLTAAREAYRAAVSLDGEFALARESLARVEREIATREYRAAVSDVHVRLNANPLQERDLRAAQAALERARRINPNAPELNELRQRLQAAVQLAGLERLRSQAADLERQERWAEAVKAYDQALAIDANAAFARAGRARAQQLAQLHTALDQYIAEPARLHSADPRAHARTLLTQADGDGPVLAGKRQRLTQLIAAAERPTPVLLKSDQSTDVTIQRVGKLGAFDTRSVELPPGRYMAIGSRAGYRDVRVPFEVPRSEPIVVQGTERIQ